jgi:hypothetical protein
VSASSSDTENIIQILGNLQPFLRKPIIKNKLIDFFKSDSEFQSNIIKLILESLPNIDLIKYNDLIKTWLEILVDFDNKQINLLIKLYLEGLEKKSEIIRVLEPSIHNCIGNFTEEQIEKLRDCFSETLFMLSFDKNKILSNLNKESLNWLMINSEAIREEIDR